ncbi:hypothetical protein ACFY9H_33600 [Streptomyces bacillaris]|uniref:hypothetical protein n=1 Tax=Streptomyces bacillaris TaxID=68179 RepID=UPI00345F5FEB
MAGAASWVVEARSVSCVVGMVFGCGALPYLPFLLLLRDQFAEWVGHEERVIAGAMVTEQQALPDQARGPFVESSETELQDIESVDPVRTGTGPDEPQVTVLPCLSGTKVRGMFGSLVVLGKLAQDEPFRESIRRVSECTLHGGEGGKRFDDR